MTYDESDEVKEMARKHGFQVRCIDEKHSPYYYEGVSHWEKYGLVMIVRII